MAPALKEEEDAVESLLEPLQLLPSSLVDDVDESSLNTEPSGRTIIE